MVVGDHVVLAPMSDGTCTECQRGAPMYCQRFDQLNLLTLPEGPTASPPTEVRPGSSTSANPRSRVMRSPSSAIQSRCRRTSISLSWARLAAASRLVQARS